MCITCRCTVRVFNFSTSFGGGKLKNACRNYSFAENQGVEISKNQKKYLTKNIHLWSEYSPCEQIIRVQIAQKSRQSKVGKGSRGHNERGR